MAPPRVGVALSSLSTLKVAQLRAIAVATGINSGGTKTTLIPYLQDEISKDRLHGFTKRNGRVEAQPSSSANVKPVQKIGEVLDHQGYYHVLSIDMGIRNLAYCQKIPRLVPIVKEWRRVAVSSYASPVPATSDDDSQSMPSPKEPFDPLTYSRLAYSLVMTLLRRSMSEIGPVTHVLIERQRYRSMGSSSVQEWTLRVNMFESMLYAVLCTLLEQGEWMGSVWPVQPSKVWGYWSEGIEEKEAKAKGKGSNSARTKREKIKMVGNWLEDSDTSVVRSKAACAGEDGQVAFENDGKLTKQRYLEKWKGKRGSGYVGKLDDLADCLLQGVAWVRWEETKRRLLQNGGLETFLKDKGLW